LGEREERRAGFSKQFLDSTGSGTDSNNNILSRLGERSGKKRRALPRLGHGASTTTSNDTAAGRDNPSLLVESYYWIPFPVDFDRYHLILGNVDPDIADDEIQRVCRRGLGRCELIGTTRHQPFHGPDDELEIAAFLQFKTKQERDMACSMTVDWKTLGFRLTPTIRALSSEEMLEGRILYYDIKHQRRIAAQLRAQKNYDITSTQLQRLGLV
jgi:hypothetical protein